MEIVNMTVSLIVARN